MKTVLLLIPLDGITKNKFAYLSECLKQTANEDIIIDAPAAYEIYYNINQEKFIDLKLPFTSEVYLFIDFGIDKLMFNVIDRCIKAGIELKYRRAIKDNQKVFLSTPIQVLKDVCKKMDISIEQISENTRKREIVDARFIYFRRARELTRSSSIQIGKLVKRDHASVLHGIKEAHTTRAVMELYESYYGKTKTKASPMAKETDIHPANCRPVERPVLPYRSMDPREQGIPERESVMRSVPTRGYYRAF